MKLLEVFVIVIGAVTSNSAPALSAEKVEVAGMGTYSLATYTCWPINDTHIERICADVPHGSMVMKDHDGPYYTGICHIDEPLVQAFLHAKSPWDYYRANIEAKQKYDCLDGPNPGDMADHPGGGTIGTSSGDFEPVNCEELGPASLLCEERRVTILR